MSGQPALTPRPRDARDTRLRSHAQFELAQRQGRRWSDRFLVLNTRKNDLTWNRLGFAISSRVGKAVHRNRLRRRLREILRSQPLQEGWDIVIIPRPGASEASFQHLSDSLKQLLRRASLVKSQP